MKKIDLKVFLVVNLTCRVRPGKKQYTNINSSIGRVKKLVTLGGKAPKIQGAGAGWGLICREPE